MAPTYVIAATCDKRPMRLVASIGRLAANIGLLLAAMVTALVAVLSSAHAHEIRPTIVDMVVEDGRAVLSVETNLEAWLAEIGDQHQDTDEAPEDEVYTGLRALAPAALEAELEPQRANFADAIVLTVAGERVPLEVQEVTIPQAPDLSLARDSVVQLMSSAAIDGTADATVAFSQRFPETILRVNDSDGTTVYSEFLQPNMPTAAFSLALAEPQGALSVFANYVAVGFEHIVPLGLDHILFVIGLFLFAARLRPLLWQVTAFTVAHTITLALGATGVLNLTPWIVETIIAASIVYVGLENIFLRHWASHRVALVFAFGLLHGLGFAGVLGDFGLPEGQFAPALIGFNIGVELGQLAVIAACLALTFWARNQSWYRSVVVVPVSAVIALIGFYWVLERTGILPSSMGGLF